MKEDRCLQGIKTFQAPAVRPTPAVYDLFLIPVSSSAGHMVYSRSEGLLVQCTVFFLNQLVSHTVICISALTTEC